MIFAKWPNMSESTSSTTNTVGFQGTGKDATARSGYYADKASQLGPLFKRLKSRRMTFRKVALYAVVATIVALSTPVMPTFIAGSVIVVLGLALRIWTFGHLEKISA